MFWDAFLGAGEENLREKLVICLVWLGLAVVFWVFTVSFCVFLLFLVFFFFGYVVASISLCPTPTPSRLHFYTFSITQTTATSIFACSTASGVAFSLYIFTLSVAFHCLIRLTLAHMAAPKLSFVLFVYPEPNLSVSALYLSLQFSFVSLWCFFFLYRLMAQ